MLIMQMYKWNMTINKTRKQINIKKCIIKTKKKVIISASQARSLGKFSQNVQLNKILLKSNKLDIEKVMPQYLNAS